MNADEARRLSQPRIDREREKAQLRQERNEHQAETFARNKLPRWLKEIASEARVGKRHKNFRHLSELEAQAGARLLRDLGYGATQTYDSDRDPYLAVTW